MSGPSHSARRAADVERVRTTHDIGVLRTAAHHPSWRVRRIVAGHRLTPPDVVERLAHDDSARVRLRACVHPALPPETLVSLARDPWIVIRERVAGHRLAPVAALVVLASDGRTSFEAAHRLAWIAERDAETAVALSDSTDVRLRQIAAGSPHRAAHRQMVQERDPSVRHVLVRNPTVDEDVLLLVADDDETAAVVVARRADLSRRALRELARRGPETIRAMAGHPVRSRLESWWIATTQDPTARAALARDAATPRLVHELLSRRGHWSIRRAALDSPHARARHIKRALTHRSAAVRYAAMASPLVASIPHASLRRAMTDQVVAMAAMANPALPPSLLDEYLTAMVPDPRTWPSDVSRWLAGAALGNPAAPVPQLQRLADAPAPAWAMRRLATNPSTPNDVSESLLTMLALGAMEGDPHFDPVEGTGNPGDPSRTAWAETDRLAVEQLLGHPVPSIRAAGARARSEASQKVLLMLAEDPDIHVRSSVLRFNRWTSRS